jgi:hypothetical protein
MNNAKERLSLCLPCDYVEVNDFGPAKIWNISFFNIITAGDSTKIEEAANYGQVRGNPAA